MPSKRYLQAWGALYGSETPPPKRQASRWPKEETEQIRLVNWMDDHEIRYYAIPNGRNSSREGARYRRMGARAGIPDLCVPYARKSYHGLYIELKRVAGGHVSAEQREWIDFLNTQGYFATVAKGCDHAIQIIEDYLQCEL